MFEFLEHISSKTKILFLSMILILLPGAIISYLSLKSIQDKAENLRTKYHGTVNLVRDKLESEVPRLEMDLRNSVIESFSRLDDDADMKTWLRHLESENPAFKNLFLATAGGALTTGSFSHGWKKLPETRFSKDPKTTTSLKKAENAEFINKDYSAAVRFYNEALSAAVSARDQAMLLSRIGRNYFKLGVFEDGIKEYRKILQFTEEWITIGNVPSSVVALSQIAYGYERLNLVQDQLNYLLDLHQLLLDHPWDLSGGDYLFYLESTSHAIGEIVDDSTLLELRDKENQLLEQIEFIEHIRRNGLAEIRSHLLNGDPANLPAFQIFRTRGNSSIQISYCMLPSSSRQPPSMALGYQIDRTYILARLVPGVLIPVELGKDISVGILDENDSLIYHQNNKQLSNYLVSENLSPLLFNWKVALFDPDEKSIEQLSGREKHLYLAIFVGIIAVMIIGVIVMARSVIHETEVSRMKSEFVSNVSHELKTPLALIRMFGETLDSGIPIDEGKRREFYSIIRKESERLTHLINNVLDFSRMDDGKKEYNFEEADLVALIRNSLEAYKFHIRDMGFNIESELPDEPILLKIDKDAISQALLNLLSNAVKYSENRKYIRVTVRKDSFSAFISVADHGVGIAKDELKKIFDKFYRVPDDKIKETRGSGLGLTLTKHIIKAHGGSIEVESNPGEGSRFTIRIPLLQTRAGDEV